MVRWIRARRSISFIEQAKEDSPASPLLYCIPTFDSGDYSCHVIDSEAPAPVSK